MQITLLRHGQTEFELSGNVRARDLKEVARSYDASGIVGTPADEVISLANDHNIILCSDLPRSTQSAEALGITNVHAIDPIFRETHTPYFNKGSIKLPVVVWLLILRVMWLFGYSENGESLSAAKERARVAAQRLIQLAKQYETVFLVGHGLFNHLIAKELLLNNWLGSTDLGRKCWEYGVYSFNTGS